MEETISFEEGQNIWDTKYNEVFKYDAKRDAFAIQSEPERFKVYAHQDRHYAERCSSNYCRCIS